jgi:hypothetical protein
LPPEQLAVLGPDPKTPEEPDPAMPVIPLIAVDEDSPDAAG